MIIIELLTQLVTQQSEFPLCQDLVFSEQNFPKLEYYDSTTPTQGQYRFTVSDIYLHPNALVCVKINLKYPFLSKLHITNQE